MILLRATRVRIGAFVSLHHSAKAGGRCSDPQIEYAAGIAARVLTALLREQSSYLSFQLGRTVWFRHQANFSAQCLGGLGGLRDAGGENDF